MNLYLLAVSARVLFVAMLIILIAVALLFGFIVFMILKMHKKRDLAETGNVKNMLARRESQIVVDILRNEHDDVLRAELVGKLRRVKMAQMLIDELIKEEEGIINEIEAEENPKKAARAAENESTHKPAQHPVRNGQRPAQRPAGMSGANGGAAQRPAQNHAQKPVQNTEELSVQQPAQDAKEVPAEPVEKAAGKTGKAKSATAKKSASSLDYNFDDSLSDNKNEG